MQPTPPINAAPVLPYAASQQAAATAGTTWFSDPDLCQLGVVGSRRPPAPCVAPPPPPKPSGGLRIEHGRPPILFCNGEWDYWDTAALGRQMARQALNMARPPPPGHVFLRWRMSGSPLPYNPLLNDYRMSQEGYERISEGISALFQKRDSSRFWACLCAPTKDTTEVLDHLRNLNRQWNGEGIYFNYEYVPSSGTYCHITTYDVLSR